MRKLRLTGCLLWYQRKRGVEVEIKFRGKRVDNGEWVEGYYVGDYDGKHYITQPLKDSHRLIQVNPATVGQGVEINGKWYFEGDIVRMHYFFENYDPSTLGAFEDEEVIIGTVGIDELGTCTENEDGKYYWLKYIQEPSEEIEIIGNIHDNGDLLHG